MAELKALQTAALEELRLQNEASEFVVVGSDSGSEFSELEDDPGAVSTDGGSDGDVASFAGGDDDGTDEEGEGKEDEDGNKAEESDSGDGDPEEEGGAPPAAKKVKLERGVAKRANRRTTCLESKGKIVRKFDELVVAVAEREAAKPEATRKNPNSQSREVMSSLRSWAKENVDNGATTIHNRSQVESFRKAVTSSRGSGSLRVKRRMRHRKTLFPLVEACLKVFVVEKRKDNRKVTLQTLKTQAEALLQDDEVSALCRNVRSVSTTYLRNFLSRNRFRVKVVQKQTPFTRDDICAKAQVFHTHLHHVLPHVDGVLNMDEVPCSLSGSMGKIKTVAAIGDKDVRVNHDANASKRSATLLAFAATKKGGPDFSPFHVPPILMLKGQPRRDSIKQEKYDTRVKVIWTPKGVVNSETMVNHVVPHVKKWCEKAGCATTLVILDCATSHLTSASLTSFFSSRLPVAVIPAGMTSWLQWVDVFFAASYRSRHAKAFEEHSEKKLTAKQKRSLLAKLVAEATLNATTGVTQAFDRLGYHGPTHPETRIRGIDPGYTFVAPPPADTEDHKERLEKKIKEAEEKGRQMAAASARDAPKGKHKKPLPPGVQKITMFTQVKTEVKAEASQPNPGSQQ
ncbi:hypothetical protein DIPPA_29905 [Diplonema papillatum]|nr:hypothetical protein DIPPA_29905 [Diplonema papillatum]